MRSMNSIPSMVLAAAIFSGMPHVLGIPPSHDPCFSPNPWDQCISRFSFRDDFIFGAASSAYQYEGAYNIDGKGQSIWDTFSHEHPEKMSGRSSGDVAIDYYHRYKEDIALMKGMGMDAYRFSISWPRVLPNGKSRGHGVVNQKGLTYYNNVINEIINQGMKPFVTIFHWDVPQHLEFEYGGFRDKRIVQDFQDYAELLFDTFGDRVKHWITFNEPSIFSKHGYDLGSKAPGRCSNRTTCTYGNSGTEPYMVAHNQLLAHAAAVDVYRKKYQASQNGTIGITLESFWMVPYSKHDIDAQQRSLDFKLGWFMQPITNGSYPESMKTIVGDRLPPFEDEEKKKLQGSIDFLGLNYYTARFAQDMDLDTPSSSYSTDSHVYETADRYGTLIGEHVPGSWIYIYPQGLGDLLVHIKDKYDNPVIYVTENGMNDKNNPPLTAEEALRDDLRTKYYHRHLGCLLRAISERGANVRGYFAWSFMDNLEWNEGYTDRFGMIYVDFEDDKLTRQIKDSGAWFKNFLMQHCPRPPPIIPPKPDMKEL